MKNLLQTIAEKKYTLTAVSPIPDKVAKQIENQGTLSLVYSLNLLEGSQLSKIETAQLIEHETTIGGKGLHDQHRVWLFAKMVDWLKRSAHSSRHDITEQLLIDLQTLLFLFESPNSNLVKYSYKVPYALTEYVEWLHQQSGDELMIAIESVVKLIQLGIFTSNLSRTSLLLLNVLLQQAGYPLISIRPESIQKYVQAVSSVERGQGKEEFAQLLLKEIDYLFDIYLEILEVKKGSKPENLLKIGQLAKLTGETIPTIRYWTKMGLLPVALHSPGGYQLYEIGVALSAFKIRQWQKDERLSVQEISKRLNSH